MLCLQTDVSGTTDDGTVIFFTCPGIEVSAVLIDRYARHHSTVFLFTCPRNQVSVAWYVCVTQLCKLLWMLVQ